MYVLCCSMAGKPVGGGHPGGRRTGGHPGGRYITLLMSNTYTYIHTYNFNTTCLPCAMEEGEYGNGRFMHQH
jgi:hypothetical protein